MQMLMCRSSGQRASGEKRRVPIVRERAHKFGPINSERVLSLKKDVLITGPNACGKTRWLVKLQEHSSEIWIGRESIFLRSLDPLQSWYEDPRIAAMVEKTGRSWSKLKAYERIDALKDWVKSTRAVVLLDDAHKLAGRKLDIALHLCREAGRLVVGAFAENNLPMSLRMLIDKRDPQRVPLSSEAAYDVTSLALWLAILATMAAGWWQLSAVLGGMKVLATGRSAAKQV